ncbi:hypothetical protein OROGR_010724 [Orobanche gracilis]
MDSRLKDASTNGDVSALGRLFEEDPLILQNAHSNYLQTPVHIAAVMGHAKFVVAVLGHNRRWARLPNLEGETPIHLASAKGHVQIVKDLLGIDATLAHLRDRDGRNFLHSAAVGRQLYLFVDLLTPESLLELTASGETILHLAVKNNLQYAAIAACVAVVASHSLDRILNIGDENGNTILHWACLRQQHKIIKLLANEPKVEVNAVNSEGLTPLDIVLSNENPSPDTKQIKLILERAGAVGQKRLAATKARPPTARPASRSERLIDGLKNGVMLMAVMFATLTFQMAMNPPGGYWQEETTPSDIISTSQMIKNASIVEGGFFSPKNLVFVRNKHWDISYIQGRNTHDVGKAIARETETRLFAAFLLYDTVCFYTSLSMIVVLAVMEALNWDNNVAAVFMLGLTANLIWFAGLTFGTGITLVTDARFNRWIFHAGLYNLGVTGFFWGLALLMLFFVTTFAWSYLHIE